jgi:co-chaperonin GroES (HSP10)
MRALGSYLLVSPVQEEIKSSTGLIMSSKDKEDIRYKRAIVKKAGDAASLVKEGDVIFYDKSGGHEIVIDSNLFVVISYRDIVVVLSQDSSS